MKKILVPTDFSNQAENALKVAAQLAKKHNSEIHLLHVLEIPMHEIDALSSYNNLPEAVYFMKLAHKQFEELINKPYLKGLVIYEHVELHDLMVLLVLKNYLWAQIQKK